MKVGDMTPFGRVREVLVTAKVLYDGWEMDNEAWAVRTDSGVHAFWTSHGILYTFDPHDIAEKIAEAEESAAGLREIARLTCPSGGSL